MGSQPQPRVVNFVVVMIVSAIVFGPCVAYEVVRHSVRREVTATILSIERVDGGRAPDWYLIRTDGPSIAVEDSYWGSRLAEGTVQALQVGERRRFEVYGLDGSWHGVYLTYADSELLADADESESTVPTDAPRP